ncbi:MAG: zinc ribbon domain-containing protein [Ruminococcaceae bacterium]|nr:zinc ribbon domain-containing protein [Oscillospiraceae bacterium]
MNLSERAAYIKGLAEGLELDTDKKEVRVIKEMLTLLTELAGDVEDISADLAMVEEELFGDISGGFGSELYEINCPNCQEVVQLDEEMLMSGNVVCPGCGETIEIEIDTCDCDHDHEHDHNHG